MGEETGDRPGIGGNCENAIADESAASGEHGGQGWRAGDAHRIRPIATGRTGMLRGDG